MQERCPNCGNYWAQPVAKPVPGLWIALTTLWLILWLLIALIAVILTVSVIQTLGGAEGWSSVLLVIAALIIGVAPRVIVQKLEVRRVRASPRRFCRSCGYEWDVRAVQP